MIEESTGLVAPKVNPSPIRVLDSLNSHYSPKAKVILDVVAVSGDGLIAPDQIATPNGVIRLAAPSSIEEYARVLYHALRSADQRGLDVRSRSLTRRGWFSCGCKGSLAAFRFGLVNPMPIF